MFRYSVKNFFDRGWKLYFQNPNSKQILRVLKDSDFIESGNYFDDLDIVLDCKESNVRAIKININEAHKSILPQCRTPYAFQIDKHGDLIRYYFFKESQNIPLKFMSGVYTNIDYAKIYSLSEEISLEDMDADIADLPIHFHGNGTNKLTQGRIEYLGDQATHLFSQGLKPDVVYLKLKDINAETNSPPVSDSDILVLLKNVFQISIEKKKSTSAICTVDKLADTISKTSDFIWQEGAGFYQWNNKGFWGKKTDSQIDQLILARLEDSGNIKIARNSIADVRRILELKCRATSSYVPGNYINFANCMLDIHNRRTVPHSKNVFSTYQINCNFPHTGELKDYQIDSDYIFKKANVSIKAIMDMMKSDKDLFMLLNECIGSCLTTDTKFQRAFFFHGSGSNGKSVILKIIKDIIGPDNCCHVNFNDLSKEFSRAELLNKLVNFTTEVDFSDVSKTEYFKAIVSGDPISARYPYGKQFSFSPYCKMIFACNELPIVKERTYAFYRRLIVIPFDVIFQGKNMDLDLEQKMRKEIDGLIYWAVCGLYRLINNGEFTRSARSTHRLEKYQADASSIIPFIDDKCIKNVDLFNDKEGLYTAYKQWALMFGYRPLSIARFESELKDCVPGFNISVNMGFKVYNGIKLKGQMDLHLS